MSAGSLRELVSFDAPIAVPDGAGGEETGWREIHSCRAEFIYIRGSEAIEAARLSGRALHKVKIRRCFDACKITTDSRMRDRRQGTVFNVREVDSLTSQTWIYIVAENGVAV